MEESMGEIKWKTVESIHHFCIDFFFLISQASLVPAEDQTSISTGEIFNNDNIGNVSNFDLNFNQSLNSKILRRYWQLSSSLNISRRNCILLKIHEKWDNSKEYYQGLIQRGYANSQLV